MNKLSIEELKSLREAYYGMQYEKIVAVLDELIAIRELKGEQVPFGYVEHQAAVKVVKGETRFAALTMEPKGDKCLPLFTGPQKPVVLLNSSTVMSRAYVVKQIEAAGGIVKDGE